MGTGDQMTALVQITIDIKEFCTVIIELDSEYYIFLITIESQLSVTKEFLKSIIIIIKRVNFHKLLHQYCY